MCSVQECRSNPSLSSLLSAVLTAYESQVIKQSSFFPLQSRHLLGLSNNLVDSLCKVIDVVGVETSHTDTAVLGHVYVGIFPDLKDLFLVQASEAEHADLVCDMVPGTRRLHLLKLGSELLAHGDDATTHCTEVCLPLCKETFVVEDQTSDASTVCGRIADLGSLQDGELACNADRGVLGLGPWRCDKVEATGTFTVEAEILCVTLGY